VLRWVDEAWDRLRRTHFILSNALPVKYDASNRKTLIIMPQDEKPKKPSATEKIGFLLHPANLAKTIGSQIPFASAGVEMANQLAGYEVEQRLESVEAEARQAANLREIEKGAPNSPPRLPEWCMPAAEYLQRTVSIAVAYDGGFHSLEQRGRELVQPVAHACIIANHEILTCKEALELARDVATHKGGRVIILAGMAWYDFEPEPTDKASGLSICRLTQRNEDKWKAYVQSWQKHGLGQLEDELIATPILYSVSAWMGQEVGFIHLGEAEDVLRDRRKFSKFQFDVTVISHFRRPKDDGLKVFVTGVLPGRVIGTGSGVFSRDGTLLGILSDTESYLSDAGRRAVVRSLLGHPHFMKSLK
jgi:hypothetical protein